MARYMGEPTPEEGSCYLKITILGVVPPGVTLDEDLLKKIEKAQDIPRTFQQESYDFIREDPLPVPLTEPAFVFVVHHPTWEHYLQVLGSEVARVALGCDCMKVLKDFNIPNEINKNNK